MHPLKGTPTIERKRERERLGLLPRVHQGERRDFPKSNPPSPTYDNDYRHQRLDSNAHEIRLLSLKCVENYEEITGFLTNVPFEAAPPYVALSYTWGTPNDRQPIYLADQKFYVNYNFFQALRQLSSGAGRKYWIDAICITKRDPSERNHQVSMMRHIYGRATPVKIWLGIGDNLSAQAFTLARDIAKAVQVHKEEELFNDSSRVDQFAAFQVLLHKEYWKRIWVIQEVNAAREAEIICGADTITWADLLMAQNTIAIN